MSQAPRRNPPPLSPTPDDPFELQPVQPGQERNLTAEILTISVIVSAIVLLGVGLMFWYRDNVVTPSPGVQIVTAPTPTDDAQLGDEQVVVVIDPETVTPEATATQDSASITAEAAARSTRQSAAASATASAESAITPSAPSIHIPSVSSDKNQLRITQPPLTPPALVTSPTLTATPTLTDTPLPPTPTDTPSTGIVSLPYLSYQEPTPTPTPAPATDTPTPTATSIFVPSTPTATLPASTPLGTPLVTPAATNTIAPTGVPYVDDNMSARMAVDATFHLGPSAVYTSTDQLTVNSEISLRGRDSSGEWVLVCCVDDDDDDSNRDDLAWVRRAYVSIEGNELNDDDEDFDRNDVRWLPVIATRADLRVLPTRTPVPEGDFPLYRYTPDNRGRLPSLPNLANASQMWTVLPEAGSALISPLIVGDSIVYGGSSDGHVYAWDRVNGSQRARKHLQANVTVAPAFDDSLLYVATDYGWLYALQDPIDSDDPFWSVNMGSPPVTGINVFSHTLFINVSGALRAIDGESGRLINEILIPGTAVYPAIGGQLLFVVSDNLTAYDIMTFIESGTPDIVWQRAGIPVSTVPPVYSTPGKESLAELYIAGTDNIIYSLDANTGEINWTSNNNEPITTLAVNQNTLFISGDGYIKARTRAEPDDGTDPVLWRTAIAGKVLGGLFVDEEHVIAFLESGSVLFMDARTGETRGNYLTYPSPATSAGAVSYPYVYSPGVDGKLHGYQQSP